VFHIAGLVMILVALVAVAIVALWVTLRVRSLASAFARLQRHPLFEVQWRKHQAESIARIQTGVMRLQEDFVALSAAIATLLIAIKELGAVAKGTSSPVDLILRLGLPWLAGVLQPKDA
jgi:hypothetical protein